MTDTTVNVAIRATKVKKPYLPAKYAKQLVFGYWLVEHLAQKELLAHPDTQRAFDFLHLFADIDAQKTFLNDFFDELSSITKNYKAMVRAHHRPPKATPARAKPAAAATAGEEKKRGRKKQPVLAPVLNEQEQIIAQLVDAANTPSQPEPQPENLVTVSDKKNAAAQAVHALIAQVPPIADPAPAVRKPRAKKAPAATNPPDAANIPSTPPAKTTKPRQPRTKKTAELSSSVDPSPSNVQPTQPTPVSLEHSNVLENPPSVAVDEDDHDDDDDDEVEIEATPFAFNGQDFLIDANHNLYHPSSFELLGVFDHAQQRILPST